MSDDLHVQVEVRLPDWYVERYGFLGKFVGSCRVFVPDPADNNVEARIHATLGTLRGEIRDLLRAAEDAAQPG